MERRRGSERAAERKGGDRRAGGRGLARLALALALLAATPRAASAEDAAVATARVPVAPERVWAVLTDFERHDRIFPATSCSSVERLPDGRVRLRQTRRVAGYTVSYTLAATMDPERGLLEAALDPSEPHDVAVLETSWRVAPHARGGTQIELRVVSRSGLPVPAWIERRVTHRTTRETLHALVRAVAPFAASPADTRIASR